MTQQKISRQRAVTLVLLVAVVVLAVGCCVRNDRRIGLMDDRGARTDRIAALDNMRVGVSGLKPRERYSLRVVDDEGRQLSRASLTSGRAGDIAPFTILFGENLYPCRPEKPSLTTAEVRAFTTTPADVLTRAAAWQTTLESRHYYVEVLDRAGKVRRAPFSIRDDGKPRIYVADRHGCPRSGLVRGRDDVYVIGRNFPAGSTVRLFAVADQRVWKTGDAILDVSGIDGTADVERVQLGPQQRDFFARVWPSNTTSSGLYDIIARYSTGERLQLEAGDVVTSGNDPGLTIQADATGPHLEQNMTVPASTSVQYYLFQDKYFNTDDVWIAVNPKDRPGGVGSAEQTARIYVVSHLTESQWVDGMSLSDVSSDGYEEVPIKGWCRNQNEIRVWQAPLTNGKYDVVVDFAPFGVYNQGQDIVDELDNVGFEVVAPVALAIVYPVNPLRMFPEKEVPSGSKRDDFFVVAKISPAAAGTPIHWDSVDIDDPSSDAAPVDPNGAAGNDNRGNYNAAPGAPDGDDGYLEGENAAGIATTNTVAGGIAYVRFHVTSQPGDNFTVRASTSSTLATFSESAAVTVWRKLHVEVDSMGAPSGTTVSGNITNVAPGPTAGTSVVTVTGMPADASIAPGRFENGILTTSGNNYNVVSNTGLTLTVQGTPPNGASFTLVDDDVVPADVPDPDIGDLVRAYARAFILPVFDTGQDTPSAAFDLNTEYAEQSGQIQNSKGTPMSTADYWTVTVHGGFQEPVLNDDDPDNEGTSRAWALSVVQGVIYLQESIRDWIQAPVAAGGAGGVDPDPSCEAGRSPRRQEILVHEVGHLLSLSHADGAVTAADSCGGVMQPSCCPAGSAGTRQSSNFTQTSLDKLRRIAKPN